MPLAKLATPIEVIRTTTQQTPSNEQPYPGTGLNITWSTGEKTFLSSKLLRTHCPCATCREQQGDSSHSEPLSPKKSRLQIISHSQDEQLNLVQAWPIGNYALGIRWGDKHDSGIFSFEWLRSLVEKGSSGEN